MRSCRSWGAEHELCDLVTLVPCVLVRVKGDTSGVRDQKTTVEGQGIDDRDKSNDIRCN